MTSNKPSPIWKSFALLPFIIFLNSLALAQSPDKTEERTATHKDNTSEYKFYAATGIEYSDNIFRLTDEQISKMEANNQKDVISGRFKNMDSVSDIMIEPTLGLKIISGGLWDGKFRLASSLTYNYFTKNSRSSYPEAKLRLSNSIGKRGDLILEGDYISGFFKKNYLSSVNDENGNGNIPRDERTYSSAIYDEYEGLIAYNYKLIKKKHKEISGFDVQPFLGFGNRKYNSIFHNRDQKITFMGLKTDLEVSSKFDVEMSYQYEDVSSPALDELVLYNEIASKNDANGDGVRKKNAPLVTRIDRSSKRNTLEIKPSYTLLENGLIFISYKRRTTDYLSDNLFDIEHYNVDAVRQQIKTGFSYKFTRAWTVEAEYCRTDDDNDEDGSYSQNNFMIKVRYNIF
jgi:hypothetical protein